ncbi:restriction endonuclease subunit S [Streptomyces sp. NPDC006641]|uniref:restriction endonuclease subunit S n=1 Tax=unclassified Streptomyces TaxID=2593676 RepID=UPI0036C1C8BF
MTVWDRVELGRVAKIVRSSVSPDELSPETPYLGLEHLQRGGRIIGSSTVAAEGLLSSKFEFGSGDILYGKLRPYLAKISAPDFSGVCSTDILPVRPGANLDSRYLLHWLRQPSMIKFASVRANGANLPRLAPNELARFSIPLPPLVEQKRIAAVLDQVDTLRVKRCEAITLLDDLVQSVFLEMFGNPATNPKGWPLGAVGEILESATYGTSEKASQSGDVPVLRMGNVTSTGEIDMADLKYLAVRQVSEKCMVRYGDVLFNRTNSAELVGKSAIYRRDESVAYAGYLVRLRVNEENSPEYLAAYLNSAYAKAWFRAKCKSIVGMANINAKEVQAMRLAVPPLELQLKFAESVKAIESAKQAHRFHLATLDELFESVQQRAFAGQLWDYEAA